MTGPTPLPPLPPPNLARLDMAPAAVLTRAADLIEQRGLAHGAYRDEYGRLCAYGAIRAACGALDNTDLADQPSGVWAHVALAAARLQRHLELVGEQPVYGSLQTWSDGRDAGHVVAMMRAAALARPRRPVDSAAPSPAAEAGVPPARGAGGTPSDSQRQAASTPEGVGAGYASPAAVQRDGADAGKGLPPQMHHPSPGAGGPGTAPTDPVDQHAADAIAAAELAGRLAAARAELARVNATQVWVATRWDGVPRHRIALDLGKGGRELTGCGQAMGSGHILPADDPWVLAHTTPCPRCWPGGA